MGSFFGALFLIAVGFVAGWRFGYKQVMNDIDFVIKRALRRQ